jgi:hypothetical protein
MKIRIEQDEDAQSPQEHGDDGLFLVADHRDFFVPPGKDRRFEVQEVIDEHRKTHWVFLLEAYIHSGVRLALAGEGNFPDRQWDVSTLGAVFVAKSEWRLRKSARKAAESLIAEWNQYLSGDVWGYVIEDDNGTHIDSCWGFYGREYCEQEAQSALKYCEEHARSEACVI